MASRAIASTLTDFLLPDSTAPSIPKATPCLKKKGRNRANICASRPHLALAALEFSAETDSKPLQADSALHGLGEMSGPWLGSVLHIHVLLGWPLSPPPHCTASSLFRACFFKEWSMPQPTALCDVTAIPTSEIPTLSPYRPLIPSSLPSLHALFCL